MFKRYKSDRKDKYSHVESRTPDLIDAENTLMAARSREWWAYEMWVGDQTVKTYSYKTNKSGDVVYSMVTINKNNFSCWENYFYTPPCSLSKSSCVVLLLGNPWFPPIMCSRISLVTWLF